MATKDLNPRSILVRAPNWIGDQILAYPFFYSLRQNFPTAHITAVCVNWVKDIQFIDHVDDVFLLKAPAGSGLLQKFKAIDEAALELKKQRQWDLGISLPNSFSSALLLYRAGVKRRRGYRSDARGLLLNDSINWKKGASVHRAQAYLNLLPGSVSDATPATEFWGIYPDDPLDDPIPGVQEKFQPEKSWAHVLGQEAAIEPPAGPFWVLAPGATAESRRWDLPNFVLLAGMIGRETGWPGVIIGGPKEAPLAERLLEAVDVKLIDYTARGSVSRLWKIFRNAKFTICNESGLAHVASLCGSPVHIICGAADPRRTRPIGPGRVQVFTNPVSCWPCEKNVCIQPLDQKVQCLRGIHPEEVWKEIQSALEFKAQETPGPRP